MTPTVKLNIERGVGAAIVLLMALGPLLFGTYWVSFILTQTFLTGIAAASLIFLSAYGGMVSLGQTALYGLSAVALGNIVTKGEAKGLHLGWNPWLGVFLAIVITTALGLLLGAVASRSAGIYFLMITLTYSVIAYYFLGQVTVVSGFSGIAGIDNYTPSVIGSPTNQPNRLYYASLILALGAFLLIRYIVRTPFGLALQGVRDEPVRMSSLGFNVALHRTLAFGFAAFLASIAGILFAWWNGIVAPDTVGLGGTIDLLIIAVIGGLRRLEGAWIGAFAFIVINNYVRHSLPLVGGSFNTVIGLIFLAIVVVSPDGLMGLWESSWSLVQRRRNPSGPLAPSPSSSG
jgi:branched-chain amino acid transport system permease protein